MGRLFCMNAETRYKLASLAFFFVLFTGFVLQFVHPYHLAKIPQAKLEDNAYIFLLAILACLVFALQLRFYVPVRTKFKFFPLIAGCFLLIVLFYANGLNRAKNLDAKTTGKIIELLKK